MKKMILFMDNEAGFLEVHSRLLKQAGYEVLIASSIAEATALLAEQFIHLAILDVRMEDDADPQDISGLKLAEEEAYQAIPKIILTAYPSWEYAEKALGAALEGLQIAGMVNKADGPDALLQAVEKAFTNYVLVNDKLVIRWSERERLSFPYFITLLEPQLVAEDLSVRTGEIEALFRRLFHDSQQVTISRLFKQAEGTLFLGLSTYSELGRESQHVMACGLKEAMAKERKQRQEMLPQATQPGSLVIEMMVETTRFAATAYSLAGMDITELVNFTTFYHYQPIEGVTNALDHLFETTLHAWYSKGRFHEEQKTVSTFFNEWLRLEELTQAEFEDRVQSICREILDSGLAEITLLPHQWQWRLSPELSQIYPNPIPFLYQKQPAFAPPYLCGTTHGQLNGDSILVNLGGQTCLIDFGQVAQGPLVRDFVALETAVKFDLMLARDGETIYEVERRLLAVSCLDEDIDSSNLEPSLQKAVETVGRIRHHAARIIGPEIEHYLVGLFFYAIARLAAYDANVHHTRRELMPYLHALLGAAMICKKLTPPLPEDLPPQAIEGLWVNPKNSEVWVESRKLDLAPREFELLHYLYQHKGQVCDRLDIAQAVFKLTFDEIDQMKLNSRETKERLKRNKADPMINATMNRLRNKVRELNPKHEYIVTETGKGYRLDLGQYSNY